METTSEETKTNAQDITLANLLASISDETLVSLVVRKKGVVRGRGEDKRVFDDDLVHVLLWTGWSYDNLVKLSRVRLKQLDKEGRTITSLIRSARAEGFNDLTVEEAAYGVQEVREALRSSSNGRQLGKEGRRSAWYKPLEVNGKTARGCKVYVGPKREEDPRAPIPGTTYIHGLKLGEVVLQKAPNGSWAPNSSARTVAKDHLRRRLPIGRYVSYALTPGQEYDLKVGREAIEAAAQDGLMIPPSVVLALFKIAQASAP